MTPERWRRVRELFDRAADLGAEERERFLERECGADAELGSEVRALLASSAAAGEFLEIPAIEQVPRDSTSAEAPPARIGLWQIERELGHGGMGTVYLGMRAEGEFRQNAAVKLVRRGMDTDFILRRFRTEREILAGLDHPYIARLLDGGSTADGLPYFAMEYVEGRHLLEDCAARGADVRQRVALFLQVCEAVAYAHRHLVVHRDLKPSNILVTAGRRAQAARLRPRQAPAARRGRAPRSDGNGAAHPDARLRQPRTGPGRAHHDLHRHLLARRRSLRVTDGKAAVWWSAGLVRRHRPRRLRTGARAARPRKRSRQRHPDGPAQGARAPVSLRRGARRRPAAPAGGPPGRGPQGHGRLPGREVRLAPPRGHRGGGARRARPGGRARDRDLPGPDRPGRARRGGAPLRRRAPARQLVSVRVPRRHQGPARSHARARARRAPGARVPREAVGRAPRRRRAPARARRGLREGRAGPGRPLRVASRRHRGRAQEPSARDCHSGAAGPHWHRRATGRRSRKPSSSSPRS